MNRCCMHVAMQTAMYCQLRLLSLVRALLFCNEGVMGPTHGSMVNSMFDVPGPHQTIDLSTSPAVPSQAATVGAHPPAGLHTQAPPAAIPTKHAPGKTVPAVQNGTNWLQSASQPSSAQNGKTGSPVQQSVSQHSGPQSSAAHSSAPQSSVAHSSKTQASNAVTLSSGGASAIDITGEVSLSSSLSNSAVLL